MSEHIPEDLDPAHRQQIEETYRLREELRELRGTNDAAAERARYQELSEYTDWLESRLLRYAVPLIEYQREELERLKGARDDRSADQGCPQDA